MERRLKGDKEKVKLARRLRQETTMTLAWIARRLKMGSWTYVANLIYEKPKRPRSVNSEIQLVSVLLFLVTSGTDVVADGFSISGTLEYRYAGKSSSLPFKVQVDGCRWLTHVDFPAQTNSSGGIQFIEDAFDGTNSYTYKQFRESLSEDGKKPVNTSQAVVASNSIPTGDSILSVPLWLAYCSSCYFESNHTGRIEDVFGSGDSEMRAAGKLLSYQCTLSEKPPRLPVSVDFFSNGDNFSFGKENELKASRLPVPFENGFKIQSFRSVTFTNLGDVSFPAEFTLESFLPSLPNASSSNDIKSLVFYTGKMESIARFTSDSHDFVPRTDGAALTVDRRFPVGKTTTWVNYMNTNQGDWVSATNPTLTKLYNEAKRVESNVNPPKPSASNSGYKLKHPYAKSMFLIVVVALLNLPWMIIAIAKRAKRGNRSAASVG